MNKLVTKTIASTFELDLTPPSEWTETVWGSRRRWARERLRWSIRWLWPIRCMGGKNQHQPTRWPERRRNEMFDVERGMVEAIAREEDARVLRDLLGQS